MVLITIQPFAHLTGKKATRKIDKNLSLLFAALQFVSRGIGAGEKQVLSGNFQNNNLAPVDHARGHIDNYLHRTYVICTQR
jgi:hypothetical protein